MARVVEVKAETGASILERPHQPPFFDVRRSIDRYLVIDPHLQFTTAALKPPGLSESQYDGLTLKLT